MKCSIGVMFSFLIGVHAVFGASVGVSPSSIQWDEATSVTVTASGLASGETVQFNLYADIDASGTPTAADQLVWSTEATDGAGPRLLANGVGDGDGTANGTIQLAVPYFDLLYNFNHVAGAYLWEMNRASNPPAPASFQVLQEASPTRWITGQVIDYVTGNPVSGAMVQIATFNAIDEPVPAVWTGTNGHFTLNVPAAMDSADVMGGCARALGYLSSPTGPSEEPFSIQPFSTAITNGANALPADLMVVGAWPGMLSEITGKVQLAAPGNPAIAGAMVFLSGDDIESLAISDADGNYRLVWPSDMDDEEVHFGTGLPDLNIREIVGGVSQVAPMAFQNDVSTNLICHAATAVLQGSVTCSAPAGTVNGLMLRAINGSDGSAAWTMVVNGNYQCALTAGGWFGEIDEDTSEAYGYYATGQADLGTITDGSTNTFPIALPNAYLLSGTVYDESGSVALTGGNVRAQDGSYNWMADCDVNFNGQYKLILPQGSYQVTANSFTGYASDTQSFNVNGTIANRNFFLGQAGILRGRLTGNGSPITNGWGWVSLLKYNGSWFDTVDGVDVGGGADEFEFTLDPGADYIVQGNGDDNLFWIPEYYNDTYDLNTAPRFNLSAGEVVSNIVIDLQEGFKVKGRVLDVNGNRVEGGVNFVNCTNSNEILFGRIDESGYYQQNIPAGENFYAVTRMGDWGYPDVYYNQTYTTNTAEILNGAVGQTMSNINFEICAGYQISGGVYDQNTYYGLPGMVVIAANESGFFTYARCFGGSGSYSMLVPTNQTVRLYAGYGQTNWIPEYYNNTYQSNLATAVHSTAFQNLNISFGLYRGTDDSDSDGLPDWQEDTTPDGNFNPAQDFSDRYEKDTDHDGQNDSQEEIAGTNPQNEEDLFMITNLTYASSQIVIGWPWVANRLYTVQWSAHLPSGFSNLAAGIERDSFTNHLDGANSGFYRVSVEKK